MREIEILSHYPAIDKIFAHFHEEEGAAFLESQMDGDFSIIALSPYLTLKADQMQPYLNQNQEPNPSELPLIAGAIGYLSYDFESSFRFYDLFIIEDRHKKQLYLVANGKQKPAKEQIQLLKQQIKKLPPTIEEKRDFPIEVRSNFTEKAYHAAIQQMKAYISEGDIYVVNLTQQLKIKSDKAPFATFQKLRKINPAPYAAYLNLGEQQVISASPERFLQIKDGVAQTRPIKGSRKRGATPEEDAALKAELATSEKDQSELLMIVDLERNDLNKVCLPGTVKVPELFKIEPYATLFQQVATVKGELKPGLGVMEVLEAVFPGGSITGAPKERAMERIAQIEPSPRGLYTGIIGYIGLDGACDFSIAIRTAVHQASSYELGVGGGLTSESEPDFEYAETFQKAAAILEALR